MRVTPESPVADQKSYLYKWDTAARRYFNHFEIHKQQARENIRRLFQNVITRNKDPIQYEHRFREVDALAARQLLGDITHDEVSELNSVMASGRFYYKSNKEPAGIIAWNTYPLGGLLLAGYGI